ncbi:MAG: leucine-rich repeat protein [Spirochaetaceae bacterium]|nr:leucine-rich repeat protein [Spirochaetaceae bacterium]
MKKICLFLITIFLFASAVITSCGGGGGGGGLVAFAPSEGGTAAPHNGGDASGWGTGTQTGNGFDPQGQSIEESEAGLLISQMAALSGITGVTIELTINGTPYPAINADETTTTAVLPKIKAGDKISGKATIYVMDDEPRVAYLDETEATLHGVLKFKVPYKYRANDLAGQEVANGTYYARDGINLYTDDTVAGWHCVEDGTVHYGSYVTGVRGDIRLNAVSASGAPVLNASASPEILYARATSSDTTTITIRNVTGSLTITPSPASVLANDPPVQDNSDPSKYTVNIYFLGGSNPAWFTDSAPASVSITDNGNGVTTSVPLTLKNKYSYQLQTVGSEWTDDPGLAPTYNHTTSPVEIEQGESLTFAAAAAVLTGHYPSDREIVSFYYNDLTSAYYNKLPTPATITFSSASFTSRSVLLKALPNLRISRNINNGGYAGTSPQDGSFNNPYLLNYYGTTTERKIQIEINDYACGSGDLTLVPDPSQSNINNIMNAMNAMFDINHAGNNFIYELKSGLAENSVYTDLIKLIATDPTTGAKKDVYIRVMKIQPYTVTFDTGAGNSTVAAQSVNPGAKATKPSPDPTNADSNLGFCGWYTSTDGGATLSATQYDFDNTTVTADITLYAKWGYTNFTGTAAQFIAAEFGTTSSSSNKYSIKITDASDANIDQILAHFKNDLSNLHFDLILQGTLTEIPANAFKYGSYVYMYSISMPASVKKIGNRAFYNCSKLNIASLPSGLEEIGDEAFNAWSNYSVSFSGTSLKKIGEKALFDMGGTTISPTLYVTVPASVEELYTNSFITAGSKSFSVTINGTNSWTKMQGNTVVETDVVLTSNDVTSNSGTIYRYVR